MLTLTAARMRLAEQLADEAGLSFAQMMENAGAISYEFLQREYDIRKKTCLVLAGNGNNAGDGFVLARKLAEAGGTVTVVLCCGKPRSKLARVNFESLSGMRFTLVDGQRDFETASLLIASVEIIVDAVYGTGFHGNMPANSTRLIEAANHAKAIKIALDIPSGIEADGGIIPRSGFCADRTIAYAAYKAAHTIKELACYCGRVSVMDIGIPPAVMREACSLVMPVTRDMVVSALPVRDEWAHKGSYGSLLNIAGSDGMCGAAMMSTLAAMRMGAGITRLATPAGVAAAIAPHLMEAMTIALRATSSALEAAGENNAGMISAEAIPKLMELAEKSTACLIGCGLGVCRDTIQIVEYMIKNTNCNIILDADGLNCISNNPALLCEAKKPVIITPHIGEMARLTKMAPEQVLRNSQRLACAFAAEHRVIVVLKGHRTIIATPAGDFYENQTGNAGLAKGGSGDVLAGMLAGLVTQGISPLSAAVSAVYLHGACADILREHISEYSILARDIIEKIPYVLKSIGK